MIDRVKGGVFVAALALAAPLGLAAQEAAPPASVAEAPAPAAQSGLAPAPVEPAAAPSPAPSPAAPADPLAEAGSEAAAPGAPVPLAEPGTETGAETETGGPIGHDLSPWGMFMAADLVVKSVMIGLAFASVVTWTIGLAKALEILGAGARARRGLRILAGSRDLAAAEQALAGAGGPVAAMVRAARGEAQDSAEAIGAGDVDGLLPRVGSHLSRIEAGAGRRLGIGTGLLATIGSTAPFVGLFGTVWGIMNSFIGISEAQTTNLAVVAPGIAEALLATALGLVAAIPAVMIYNVFARATANYKALLADAAAAVERLASRDLDHRRLVAGRAPLARAAE